MFTYKCHQLFQTFSKSVSNESKQIQSFLILKNILANTKTKHLENICEYVYINSLMKIYTPTHREVLLNKTHLKLANELHAGHHIFYLRFINSMDDGLVTQCRVQCHH